MSAAGRWQLTSVILVTWEDEIRRLEVQSQPWEIVFKAPCAK
jgi:hypothetical protein